MRYLLVLCLMLIGCGPSNGDIYENLITRQRVTVVSGSVHCGKSYDRQKGWDSITPKREFTDDQSEGQCFTYFNMRTLGLVFVSHEGVGKEWKKLN